MQSESKPAGWTTITPRILTPDVEGLVAFLQAVFDAEGKAEFARPSVLRIGDSMLMVSDGGGLRSSMPAFLHLYVNDVDATYRRAIDAGAYAVEPPGQMPWGDRRATVSDQWGNLWQIAAVRDDTKVR